MKLIKHIIIVDLDDGKKLLINSLHGHIDEIDKNTYDKIAQWQQLEDIDESILTIEDDELYEYLNNRGFLVHDDEEEARIKDAMLTMLRHANARDRKHRKLLTFILTYGCNFACTHCHNENKASNTITKEQIDAALLLTDHHLEYIDFHGGEPLLPKTKPLMAYIFQNIPDKKFGINTNGYHLDEFVDLLKTVHVYRVTVTLDGIDESHDKRRTLSDGNPTFNKIIMGIEKCLENNLPIRIRTNVTSVTETDKIKNYFNKHTQKYGDLITFEDATPKILPHEPSNHVIADIYRSSIHDTPQDRLKKHGLLASFNPIINAITVSSPIQPIYSFCYAHGNKLVVDPYGRMYTCLFSAGKEDTSVGTYYPTYKIKKNSIYNRNIDTIEACNDCIYSLLCGGGCPMRLKSHKNVLRPFCKSIKSQIHDLLPKLYEVEKQKYYNQV